MKHARATSDIIHEHDVDLCPVQCGSAAAVGSRRRRRWQSEGAVSQNKSYASSASRPMRPTAPPIFCTDGIIGIEPHSDALLPCVGPASPRAQVTTGGRHQTTSLLTSLTRATLRLSESTRHRPLFFCAVGHALRWIVHIDLIDMGMKACSMSPCSSDDFTAHHNQAQIDTGGHTSQDRLHFFTLARERANHTKMQSYISCTRASSA